MQRISFTSFYLGELDQKQPPNMEQALEVISDWVFDKPNRNLNIRRPEGWPFDCPEDTEYENGAKVSIKKIKTNSELQTVAVRFEHLHSYDGSHDRFKNIEKWRTDCILTRTAHPIPRIRFSSTLFSQSKPNVLAPFRPPITHPKIVKDLIQKFEANDGAYNIINQFISIGPDAIGPFVENLLLSQDRKLPVIFISRTSAENALPIDKEFPSELARRLVGQAHVATAKDSNVSWKMKEFIDNSFTAYNGAVRIYWPGLSRTDRPQVHNLWLPHGIKNINERWPFKFVIFSHIAHASKGRQIPMSLWEHVEDVIDENKEKDYRGKIERLSKELSKTQESMKKAQSAEFIQGFEETLKQTDELKLQRKVLETENNQKDQKIESLERENKQLGFWKFQKEAGVPDIEIQELDAFDFDVDFESSEGVIALAKTMLENRLIFLASLKGDGGKYFEKPDKLFSALLWLAGNYWEAKAKKAKGVNLDEECRKFCGFKYNAHPGEAAKMYPEDYRCEYNRKKVDLGPHIKYGTKMDPRRTIRIGFNYLEKEKKVLVGFIGQHQKTRHSN